MDVVVTTIFPPTAGTTLISAELGRVGGRLWIIGDRKGPVAYDLSNTRFYEIESQLKLPFQLARLLPERHYARKNIGYLLAIQQGARFLVETDDDNIPLPEFWLPRSSYPPARRVQRAGWVNAYLLFSRHRVWPRGFPLEELQASFADTEQINLPSAKTECLIQQGLANQNPDVDAVYRLTGLLPVDFDPHPPVSLGRGAWCPFNSQNTTFFEPAFPLLYLPTHCTFRMTDIWRSFVAQRCLWEMNSEVCFTQATVRQERNEHDLMQDFEDELPGYLKNNQIRMALEKVELKTGRSIETVLENLVLCYEALVREGIFPKKELTLLQAWSKDLSPLC